MLESIEAARAAKQAGMHDRAVGFVLKASIATDASMLTIIQSTV